MMKRWSLLAALLAVGACGDDGNGGNDTPTFDAAIPDDAEVPPGCDPATVLPTAYRPIASVSTGTVQVTTAGGVTSGTLDATAGGAANSADQPYLYVDLRNGTRVDINDLEAWSSTQWDIALKRSSLRINGGDSGPGNRKLAIVEASSLAEVTSAPTTGYTTDDFATDDCMLVTLPGGEPMTAFGEWYDYNIETHQVEPKPEVYVLERNNGSHTAFRIITYYGDPQSPMRGAYYRVEWKNLP